MQQLTFPDLEVQPGILASSLQCPGIQRSKGYIGHICTPGWPLRCLGREGWLTKVVHVGHSSLPNTRNRSRSRKEEYVIRFMIIMNTRADLNQITFAISLAVYIDLKTSSSLSME